jgi:hypothetical protein
MAAEDDTTASPKDHWEGEVIPPTTNREPQPWPYVEADVHGWPDASDCDKNGFGAELCKAKLEVRKKRTDQEIARQKAEQDADLATEQEYYKAVLEVGKGAIERARASAETVQKAAAAIVTLYTGVLVLAFSASETPLPGKALFAAVLFGLAILLSTAFLAYLPEPQTEDEPRPEAGKEVQLGERLTNMFVAWTRNAALQRAHILRASVVALAAAVIMMPAPFVTVGDKTQAEKPDIAWPKPDPSAGNSVQLQKVLYSAQVQEAAEQRKAPIAAGDNKEGFWWGVFAIALLAIVVVLASPRLVWGKQSWSSG